MVDKKEFRFNYEKYRNKNLSVEQIDDIGKLILKSGGSTWQQIILLVKLVAIAAWFFARKSIMEHEMLVEKNNYELGRLNNNSDIIGEDDLD